MEKVKKMDQLIKFLVVFSILLSHIPIDMVYAEEISQSNNTVESNRQESEQVMNHPLERNNPLVQLIANPPEGGNPQQFVSPTPTGSIPGIMARPNVNWRFVKWEISSSIGVSVNDVYAESSLITVQGAGEAVIQAIYERIPGGIVTVRHVDESGNEIANTVLLNGYQGESYTAEAKNISGWELMTTPQNAAGTFTGVDQTVVFTYKRIPAGEVLVKYVDESGNDVAESATLTGYYGDTYTAEAKTIEGWELITVPDNVSGTFSDTGQTVVFVYQRQLSLWGTVPWDYDEVSKTITLYGGVAGLVDAASWKLPSMATEFIVVKETVVLPANSGQLFMGASNLRAIEGANKFDTSSVTHMNWMFGNASSLESLDLNQWDTSSVIDMTAMFNGTSSLKELAIENFDTSKVTNMSRMFAGTTSLEELSIGNWNTQLATTMSMMFARSGIIHLDLNNWNTRSLEDISWMFQNASIRTVSVKDWNTTKVQNMTGTFQNAVAITELDLSDWTTDAIPVTMTNLFGGMSGLKSLTLGERSVFSQSTSLPNIPVNNEYTGRWILYDSIDSSQPIAFSSSAEFMNNYNGSHPGTYIWEPNTLKELSAGLHPVSDQSDSITGYMTESVDVLSITYQNTDGSTVVIEKDSPRIEWGDYQDPQQQIRSFKIVLAENERLETTTKVILFLSKPSVNTLEDITIDREVIKGIEYRANNITLDRLAINDLASNAELHQMILRESRASAKNLLTGADLSSEIRVIETDLTLDTTIDGTYYARLEVGNKAYQFWIGIDVSSKLEHLKVTIPTKMIFESLYDDAESNRSFESADYEIQNQSRIPVDTYVTQLAITDDAGITLLAEGESPLDYVTPIHQDQASESGIPIPLLRLSIKTEEAEVQLSERMAEQHFVRLSQRSHVPVKLSGHYYGPYPSWITDDQMQQGGYYEESLAPKYQIILRFVP
ncbi:MucBP domain-containing protein [Enterococcus gallinarum]|uniref:MucBP domain-containing protein n=1 Tax=Enterococcus gallinarum TaxID=1353 RepID=UPI00288F15D9|nr:BspA family leucine-rich repeat surface protein [Enterococcus gallinarum]MDT2719258.1 BspA family leucine-rich repeat surface protein [Enterococcus gallinarum]MDV7784973.1 BspA family leucine-rich repeat surface protein [Enterococcus gallinarum]